MSSDHRICCFNWNFQHDFKYVKRILEPTAALQTEPCITQGMHTQFGHGKDEKGEQFDTAMLHASSVVIDIFGCGPKDADTYLNVPQSGNAYSVRQRLMAIGKWDLLLDALHTLDACFIKLAEGEFRLSVTCSGSHM